MKSIKYIASLQRKILRSIKNDILSEEEANYLLNLPYDEYEKLIGLEK